MNEFGFNDCPLCRRPTTIDHRDHLNWLIVKCERCGEFDIKRREASSIDSIEKDDHDVRSKLPYWIKAQNAEGVIPEIGSQQIRNLVKQIALPTPEKRVEILLDYLGNQISLSSDSLKIFTSDLRSMLGTQEWGEIDSVIKHLMKQGLIEADPHRFHKPDDHVIFSFTREGWGTVKRSSSKDKSKLAAIVFTDIVGFTKLSSANEEKAQEILKQKSKVVKPVVNKHGGKVIKGTGDGFLLFFGSSINAVQCCIEIQQKLAKYEDYKVRIGIHQGDVIERDDDVLGLTVDTTKRIESLSPEGGISISRKVHEDIANRPDIQTQSIGFPALKNMKAIEIYEIISHDLPHTSR